MTIRVLIADDQPLVRAGLRKIVETDDRLEIAAEAIDGLAAVDLARRMRPDVIVMDIRMPRLNGIEATRRLVGEAEIPVRILILTTFGLDEYVFDALHAGASGFMLKDAPPEELLAAIHLVAAGEALLHPGITRTVVERFARLPRPSPELIARLADLTPREREVFEGLARGLSNAEIASHLILGEGTIKTHVARILAKLELRDRIQAVIYAYEAGVVEPGAG